MDPRYDTIDWNVADRDQLIEVHQDNVVDDDEEEQQQQPQQQQQQQASPKPSLPVPAEPPKSSSSAPPAMSVSPAAHRALVAERERRALLQVERRIREARLEIEREMATAENCGTPYTGLTPLS